MDVDFRNHPMFPPGFNSPTRFEADIYDCEVWGEIPTDIEGTFIRMQCDYAYRPPENDWSSGFNGDGHISTFRFANGSVDYKGRYVLTDRLKAERAARRRMFGVYRNRLSDSPAAQEIDRGTANTHVYWHAGKFLVLKEDSLPYVMDPHTLETQGRWDFHGKFTATSMSAHPKIDPLTGEMFAYSFQAKGDLSDDVALYTIDPQGHVSHEVWFKSPYIGIMHDMAFTRKYILIPITPLVTSLDRLRSGEPMWEWDPSYPTMVAVLPRGGEARDVRWFQGPPRGTLHFLNATDRPGDKITMETPGADDWGGTNQLKRWTFDMSSRNDTFQEETIAVAGGLSRMDDRFLSLPYRYAFVAHRDPDLPYDNERGADMGGRVSNAYHRVDVNTGEVGAFYVGPVQGLQEPCFVPRKGGTEEGDGYVMGIAQNYESMTSDLVIVDAQRMEEGAIATVKLPFRMRSGTHTNWFPATDLPLV